MSNTINITNKKMVEQAWDLYTKLKRCIENNCTDCIKDILGGCKITDKQLRTRIAQERAYARYVRRLNQLWTKL